MLQMKILLTPFFYKIKRIILLNIFICFTLFYQFSCFIFSKTDNVKSILYLFSDVIFVSSFKQKAV